MTFCFKNVSYSKFTIMSLDWQSFRWNTVVKQRKDKSCKLLTIYYAAPLCVSIFGSCMWGLIKGNEGFGIKSLNPVGSVTGQLLCWIGCRRDLSMMVTSYDRRCRKEPWPISRYSSYNNNVWVQQRRRILLRLIRYGKVFKRCQEDQETLHSPTTPYFQISCNHHTTFLERVLK
jgi:hypothetical protein